MPDPKKLENYIARDPDGRLWLQRACVIPPGQGLPGHPCVGENRVVGFDGFFDIQGLIEWVMEKKPQAQTISFEQVWWQSHHEKEAHAARQTARYEQADTSFPGILAPLPNPAGKPYRMLDGRHRLWKMQDSGKDQGDFYVIPADIAFQHFWLPVSRQSLAKSLA